MAAETEIKFFVYTNSGAPKLNNEYGCMLNVLDACLVNGYGAQSILTLSSNGKTITADFGKPHNLLTYQVIKITGADQDEYNGEHRILSTTQNTITFSIDNEPLVKVATGIILASLPPAGWDKVYSSSNINGGGKAAYRSKSAIINSAPFLRVVDELDPSWTATYAKYAKVGIVSEMASIDDVSGLQTPYDGSNVDKNWVGSGSGSNAINGWAKWYYSRNIETWTATSDTTISAVNTSLDSLATINSEKTWFIVASSTFIYIFNNVASNKYAPSQTFNGLAMLESDGAVKDWALFAEFSYSNASETKQAYFYCGLTKQDYNSISNPACYIHTQSTNKVAFSSTFCLTKQRDASFISGAGYASDYNSAFTLLPVYCIGLRQYSDNYGVILGKLPSLLWVPGSMVFKEKQTFTDGVNLYISKTCGAYNQAGQVGFNLGAL